MSSMPMLASSDDAPPPTLPVEWIERLFRRLGAVFGTKLADSFAGIPLADVKREWGEALAEFRPEEIRRGIEECRTRRWPPNLPEFLILCRPALDPEQAWHEAADGLRARDRGEQGVWSHPAVWRAATTLSSELRAGSFSVHRAAWVHRLKVELRAGWGEEVPPPRPALPPAPSAPADPARVKAEVAKLKADPMKPDAVRWGWAQRIVDAHRAGRLTTATILKMALEVLELHGERPTLDALHRAGEETSVHPDRIPSGQPM